MKVYKEANFSIYTGNYMIWGFFNKKNVSIHFLLIQDIFFLHKHFANLKKENMYTLKLLYNL